MSEQPAARPAPARKENAFTHKIGPLPMWVWVAIVGGALVAWRLYSSSKANAAANQQPTTTPSTPANQVPQFVNQTYVDTTAPAAPTTPAPTPSPGGPVPPFPPFTGGPVPSPNTPPTTPVKVTQFPPPTGLRTTNVANNSVGLQWTPVPSGTQYPGSYTVAVYDSKGKEASQTTVTTPDTTGGQGATTVAGLNAKTAYHANVWANGGSQAPKHASVSFKTT